MVPWMQYQVLYKCCPINRNKIHKTVSPRCGDTCLYTSQEAEEGALLGVQGQPIVHTEFQASK